MAAIAAAADRPDIDLPPRPYRVDLNTDDPAALQLLPLIGRKTADRVYLHRQVHGGFASLDDLREVKGIGPRTAAAVAPWVEFGRQEGDAATPVGGAR